MPAMELDIVKQKIEQVAPILEEEGIDLWLIFVRETPMMADPTLPMVVGFQCTWQSLFAFTRNGDAIALVGNYDLADFRDSGRFTEATAYTEGVGEDVRKLIERLAPNRIAVNYSVNDVAADGLTHGMYQLLTGYLKDTACADRFVSAEGIVAKLRARKLAAEVDRLRDAAKMAAEIWTVVSSRVGIGMTEKQIAHLIEGEMDKRDVVPSFETIVNAGAKTEPGHGSPTSAILEPGDLLHVDFGVILNDYCSDIQRLLYFKKPDELAPPESLIDAFNCVKNIISETSLKTVPGVQGYEVDALARHILRENGYDEYQHALGHQLGRSVHDGGAILGPKWERYGSTPTIPLELNNVFTLELGISLDGIGYVGLEEDVVITEQGAQFLCPRQMELHSQ